MAGESTYPRVHCTGQMSICSSNFASTDQSTHLLFKLQVVKFLWEGFRCESLQLMPLTTHLYFCCVCAAITDHDPKLPPSPASMDPYIVVNNERALVHGEECGIANTEAHHPRQPPVHGKSLWQEQIDGWRGSEGHVSGNPMV